HRRRIPDRDAMNGIFFVLKTGCQWNALNETGICSSSSAHRRFQEWAKKGVFKKIWRHNLEKYDEIQGIDWSFCSTDGAMTKAPLGGEKNGKNPTDRAKIGTKRSLTTDKNGIPLSCPIAGANRNDFKMLRETLEPLGAEKSDVTRSMCLDKGYDFEEVRTLLKELGWIPHIRTRGEEKAEKKDKKHAPKRWVVERTHSWMNRFRGMLIRWCKKAENYQAQIYLVCSYITAARCGLLG
ncbi:MAG: IS5 family transposase, partial [Acidobacteriota bacterium]